MPTPLTPAQERLRKKHGTPAEFAAACKNALGDISVQEMDAAVAKYDREWKLAGESGTKWLKIIVTLKNDAPSTEIAWGWVQKFEEAFGIKNLYYARYQDLLKSSFEVSAETTADEARIKRFFRRSRHVIGVKVENRGTGSLAHAIAYQAMKHIKPVEEDTAQDKEFLDVIHWMNNMRGHDYMREIRFYNYAALVFADMLVRNNETMKRNSQFLAAVTGEGKAPGRAKGSSGAPGSKPGKSAPSAFRKAPASRRRPSAGSGRRSPGAPSAGRARSRK
jgi:hypothetical protein